MPEIPLCVFEFLERPPDIFVSRKDPEDPRLGDLVRTGKAEGSGDFRFALLGCPQDVGVRRNGGRAGAAQGPDAIRRALYKLTPFADPDASSLADLGNIRTEGLDLRDIQNLQKDIVACLVGAGIVPIVLGGGHDIAYPDAAGLGAGIGDEFGLVNFDAHADVRPLIDGQPHSGSPFRQVLEDPGLHVPTGAFVEFGLCEFSVARAHADYVLRKGMHILWNEEVRNLGFEAALDLAARKASAGRRPFFVSFDMDAAKSADAPGVSAPNPVGFSARKMCRAARFFGENPLAKVVDIAELNPAFDLDNRTAKLAALMVWNFCAGCSAMLRSSAKNI